jgi:hypothetical protein
MIALECLHSGMRPRAEVLVYLQRSSALVGVAEVIELLLQGVHGGADIAQL